MIQRRSRPRNMAESPLDRPPRVGILVSGSLRADSHNSALLRSAAELFPDDAELCLIRAGARPVAALKCRTKVRAPWMHELSVYRPPG